MDFKISREQHNSLESGKVLFLSMKCSLFQAYGSTGLIFFGTPNRPGRLEKPKTIIISNVIRYSAIKNTILITMFPVFRQKVVLRAISKNPLSLVAYKKLPSRYMTVIMGPY